MGPKSEKIIIFIVLQYVLQIIFFSKIYEVGYSERSKIAVKP